MHAQFPAAEVVVDDSSYDLLKGSVIDYVEEMMSASFQVNVYTEREDEHVYTEE